jgi:hypothetical protein
VNVSIISPAECRRIKQSRMHMDCVPTCAVSGNRGLLGCCNAGFEGDKYFFYSHLFSLDYMHTGCLDIRQLPRSSRASQPFTAAYTAPLYIPPAYPWSMRNEAPTPEFIVGEPFSLSRVPTVEIRFVVLLCFLRTKTPP